MPIEFSHSLYRWITVNIGKKSFFLLPKLHNTHGIKPLHKIRTSKLYLNFYNPLKINERNSDASALAPVSLPNCNDPERLLSFGCSILSAVDEQRKRKNLEEL